MIRLIRTNSQNSDFIQLVQLLDQELAIADGDLHEFYDQFNGIDSLEHTLVAYLNDVPVGCGAIRSYDDNSVEIKRMFTLRENRGQNIASAVLAELEVWAMELGNRRTLLETGSEQHEALQFYPRKGYVQIPNYGQYASVENSHCFEKLLC